MNKNNKTFKIIICGNTQSGKSIFINDLYRILPQKYTALIRACPDGEGVWSSNKNNEQIQNVRRKGKFNTELVKKITQEIDNEKAPIVLIDTGGIRSEENKEIFKHADSFIVISKEETEEWIKFAEESGIKNLAVLKSEVRGNNEIYEDNENGIRGIVTGLSRGTNSRDNEILKKIAKRICEVVSQRELEMKGKECAEEKETLNMHQTAKALKMIDLNGNIKWEEEKADLIYYYLKGFMEVRNTLKIFESRANWITGMVCETAKEQNINNIKIYDAGLNKYLTVRNMPKEKMEYEKIGSSIQKYDILQQELQMYIAENEENILIDLEIPAMHRLNYADLQNMKLPQIDENKKLYISGRLPMWLFAGITLSYQNKEKSVLQPGNGFITYKAKNENDLGNKEEEIGIDIQDFFLQIKALQEREE